MPNWAKLRRAGMLTQYELGGLAKVGRNKIANVETGRAEFTPEERERIIAVLAARIGRTVAELNKSFASDSTTAHQGIAG